MRETPLSHIWAHTADVNESDKQKSGFLDLLRKPKVAHADGQGAVPFPLEMVTSSGYGFARAEEALDEFFHPTDGLGPAATDDGGGQCWRELHSTGRRGVLGDMEKAAVLKQLAPPTC